MRILLLTFMSIGYILTSGCAAICCSASGEPFSNEVSAIDGKAVVYIYRPFQGASAGSRPVVLIDGDGSDRLLNSGYVVKVVNPGKHEIDISWTNQYKKEFVFESGKIYYLKYDIRDCGGYISGNAGGGSTVSVCIAKSIVPVDRETALNEIRLTKLSK